MGTACSSPVRTPAAAGRGSVECSERHGALGFGSAGASLGVDPTTGHFFVYDHAHTIIDEFQMITGRFVGQTDRPELLELTIDKGPAFKAAVAALKEIAGDTLGEIIDEKVIGTVSPTELALNWRWQLPREGRSCWRSALR